MDLRERLSAGWVVHHLALGMVGSLRIHCRAGYAIDQ